MALTFAEKQTFLRLQNEKRKRTAFADFPYFVEEFCWIEDKEAGEAIPFKLWPAQVSILPDFISSDLLIILKARQLGLTWLTAAYSLWLILTKSLQLAVVISAKEEWAIEFLDRVKFMMQRLPDFMRKPVKQETGQILSLRHPKGEVSEIKSLATTPEGAQSKTPNLLVLDETARNRYVRSIYASSKPGIDKAGGQIIVISNSHKDGPGWAWTRGIFVNAMKGLNSFTRVFMPWWDCPDRPKNFKELQMISGMDEEGFSQNYPESESEAVSAMLGSYFGSSLKKHLKSVSGIEGFLEKDRFGELEFARDGKGILEIWRYPYYLLSGYDGLAYTDRYCIGSDVSEGLGASNSVAYVMDRKRDQIIARMAGNRVDAYTWALKLHELAKYYGDAMICTERTGAGQTTVKKLAQLGAKQTTQMVPDRVGGGVTKQWGWGESQQAKHTLSGDLKAWFMTTEGGMFCAILVDECGSWIRHENGKIGPEEGAMGDHVIAAGLTIQASQYIGVKPEKAVAPVTGWKARRASGGSAWAA